jgi:hypothetical protein
VSAIRDVEREAQPLAPTTVPGAPASAPLRIGRGMSPASVLALQRTAGNRAVARALAARPVLARVPANYQGLFDYDALADELHRAASGPGTDEQAIYHVLERLQRDPQSVTQLEAAYQRRHNVTLVSELQDELSGSELNYALALINRGGTALAATPASPTDHDAAAQKIHTAVDGPGTDEEAVYAALQPYGRNTGLIATLRQSYQRQFGADLRADLVDDFSGDELQHVLYLLGESALEQAELSPADVQRLFTVMAGLSFTDATGAQSPVPYHYPVDGCYARAHMMATVMTQAGISSQRVFATSTVPGQPLTVASPFSADQPGGATPTTRWFYHVAPLVMVRTATGVAETVIDPSTQSGPVALDVWLGTMGVNAGTYQRMTQDQLVAHLHSPNPIPLPNEYPANERLVWTADRNTMYPGEGASPDSGRADAQLQGLNPTMTTYARLATIHELAAAVRAELANPAATSASVIAVIRRGDPTWRGYFWTQFPRLHTEAVARFPTDEAALDAAVGP